MKTGRTFVTALFALATLPLVAQQPSPAPPPASPATQQPPATAQPDTQTAPPATPAVEMSPVKGELVSKLDSKTAKTGDDVVVQTRASVKTADGTEIPKGSKLMGHVVAVKASGAGANSQVALQFDRIELKGGQSMAVYSQIQSLAPPEGAEPMAGSPAPMTGSPGMTGGAMSGPPAGSSPSMGGANNKTSNTTQVPSSTPGPAPAATGLPAAGTVVATSGQIAIRTTSVPGVLLANNVAGQQDPRMAQASSILVGSRRDIQLDGGTQLVVGVAAAGGGTR
jgi:hypothetical protein